MASSLNSVQDGDCRQIARRLKHFYILGKRMEGLPEILPLSELPQEIKRNAAERYPGCVMIFGYRSKNSDNEEELEKEHYTICIYHEKKYFECLLMDDGDFYSREVDINENRNSVRLYISQLLRERGGKNIRVAITDNRGSEFIGSSLSRKEKRNWRFFPAVADLQPVEFDGYRYQTISLPDNRRVMVGWNIRRSNEIMRSYVKIFLFAALCAALAGALLAWLLTRRFIGGIKRTTLAMNRISKGDYSYRISQTDNDPEIRQLMETFNEMNSRTEKVLLDIKLMSDNVAHDLRTPLTRISGTVELLLRDRSLAEPVRSVCVSVAEETNRLKDMVNTLMDISRTSRGPDELNAETVDLNELLRDFCDFLLPEFEDKNLALQLDLPETPVMISADKGKLQRLLSNLLENALKFTQQGFVAAEIKTHGGKVILTVRDSGCGIDPKDMPRLFERFFRCDSSRHYQGNGLGLALVKAICDAHKWQIEVKSRPGEGTAFIITIPAADKNR